MSRGQLNIFILLLVSGFMDGIGQGIFLLKETIAIKALSATDFQVSLISLISFSTLLFSIFFTSKLRGKPKRKLLFLGLFFGRLIFIFSPAINNAWVYIIFLFLYYTTYAIHFPVINMFYQIHFPKKRGKLYGVYRALLMLLSMISSMIIGNMIDTSNLPFYIPLIIAGVTAAFSFLALIVVDKATDGFYENYRSENIETKQNFKFNITEVFSNKGFLLFEAVFMIYGFGFMILQPAIPIYLVNELKMDYSQMAFVRGVASQIFRIILLPFAGSLFDRKSPWFLGSISYSVLSVFPILIIISFFIPINHTISIFGYSMNLMYLFVYIGFMFFSVALTGMSLMWNLGSIYFARDKDSSTFQGMHVTLTGLRGFFGPFIGYLLINKYSSHANYYVSLVLFIIAALSAIIINNRSSNANKNY